MSKIKVEFFTKKNPWSIIKDQLLGCYLAPYFQMILGTQRPVLYVDAFAGKGMFDDGNKGSPVIVLEIISEALRKTTFGQPQIEACFMELNHADDLKKNLRTYKAFTVVEGKYEENIEQQLQGKESHNVFLYLDPYGFKSLHFSIFKKIAMNNLYSVEMLINFNSFGFIREACSAKNATFDISDLEELIEVESATRKSKQKPIEDLNEVAGGSYWQGIIEDYKKDKINGYEAEKQFADMYCDKMREQFDYVLNMPIKMKKGQRPKYRMIHVTNHARGCVLMNDNMCKRWEALQDLQNQGQISMFAEDVENNSINKKEVQKEIIEIVGNYDEHVDLDKFLAEFVSKFGVRFPTSEICKELDNLCNLGALEVLRIPEFTERTRKASKFWTTSKGKIVKVRYIK